MISTSGKLHAATIVDQSRKATPAKLSGRSIRQLALFISFGTWAAAIYLLR